MYLLEIKPFAEARDNMIGMMNEIILMIVCYSFLPFSEAYEIDVDTRIILGYFPIILASLYLVINLTLLSVFTVQNIFDYVKKKRR